VLTHITRYMQDTNNSHIFVLKQAHTGTHEHHFDQHFQLNVDWPTVPLIFIFNLFQMHIIVVQYILVPLL